MERFPGDLFDLFADSNDGITAAHDLPAAVLMPEGSQEVITASQFCEN